MPLLYDLFLNTLNLNASLAMLLAVSIPCLVVFLGVQGVAGASTYVERKVAADIQRRVGPNKCNIGSLLGAFARAAVANGKAPNAGLTGKVMALALTPAVPLLDLVDKLALRFAPGVMIFLADGMKLIMKEDIIPDPADKPLFKIAPTIVLAAAMGALAVLPYSDAWYVCDFNIGVFYIAAITSIEVLGILMAGWASNNKWALLGGMRSAAQIVSYELPVALAILTGITISGTLSMQGMTYDQFGYAANGSAMSSGWFWQWNIFHPAMFILFPVYFLSALAECNRTPFDIPEAESELVSGYHTEYSGMRFGFFFMAEYAMMCVTCAIAVTLFLGGWSTGIGFVEKALMATYKFNGQDVIGPQFVNGTMVHAPEFAWYGTLIHLGMFCIKTYFLVFIMMWIRWTLPRFRVDQMMTVCWKKLIPLSMLCFTGVCVWQIARMPLLARGMGDTLSVATFWLRAIFAVSVVGGLIWYFKKPLTKEQVDQREMLAKSNLNLGTAL